jgi:hypothetical protein
MCGSIGIVDTRAPSTVSEQTIQNMIASDSNVSGALVNVLGLTIKAWRYAPMPPDTRDQSALLGLTAPVALVLSAEPSWPLYERVGVLRAVQWPYRFATVAGLAVALPMCSALVHAGALPRFRAVRTVAPLGQCALVVGLLWQAVANGTANAPNLEGGSSAS